MGVQVNLSYDGGAVAAGRQLQRRMKNNNRSVRVAAAAVDAGGAAPAVAHEKCRVNILRSFDDMCAACLSEMAGVLGAAFDDFRLP